jgi:hypothetical protein
MWRVTIFRPARGAGAPSRRAPHAEQKRASSELSFPQLVQ